jgi:hypothetical protein
MTETELPLPADTSGTEITRFNALKHGVLSRYTVLPWEDADEYSALVDALTTEHAPLGPTEEHLVEDYRMAQASLTPGRGRRSPARFGGNVLVLS